MISKLHVQIKKSLLHARGLRDVSINLAGQGVPLLLAVATIPVLIQRLGTDRFGVLTLGWALVGYFGLFDMGIGRALTKLVAQARGRAQLDSIRPLVATAVVLTVTLGLVGAGVLAAAAEWITSVALNLPLAVQDDACVAMYFLAAAVPFAVSTSALCGVLEAHQHFGRVASIRMVLALASFGGPLVCTSWNATIAAATVCLFVGRIAAFGIALFLCKSPLGNYSSRYEVRAAVAGELLKFGGWLTISNVVGPLLLYSDRFVIACTVSAAAVAYYATPYEVVTKILVLPAALLGVMFPEFARCHASGDRIAPLFRKAMMTNIAVVAIPVLAALFSCKYLLAVWLGAEMANHTYAVARILCVGVFLNSIGLVSQSLIQAIGRPDITAKLHVFELPLYAVYLFMLTQHYGLIGAALAWVIRVAISAIILSALAHKLVNTANVDHATNRNTLAITQGTQ